MEQKKKYHELDPSWQISTIRLLKCKSNIKRDKKCKIIFSRKPLFFLALDVFVVNSLPNWSLQSWLNPFSKFGRRNFDFLINGFAQKIVHSSKISFSEKRKQFIVDTITIWRILNPNDPQNRVIFSHIATGVVSLQSEMSSVYRKNTFKNWRKF